MGQVSGYARGVHYIVESEIVNKSRSLQEKRQWLYLEVKMPELNFA